MGGPAASVLLRKRLTDSDQVSIRDDVNALRTQDLPTKLDLEDFQICSTRAIGGHYTGTAQPFSVSFGIEHDWEREHSNEIGRAFGFDPQDEISICAFCSGDTNHRILAELCIHWAERFDGIIDFGGALWPHPLPADSGIDVFTMEWQQMEPYFRKMVNGLPGRIEGFPYETDSGRSWMSHAADVTFVKAWLNHPQFHMVK